MDAPNPHHAKEAETMTDTIRDRLACWTTSGLAPHLYVKALSDMGAAVAHIDAQDAKIKALVEALEACRDELDAYSLQEYPTDHPVHQRYRKRDYDANPARIALAAAKETTA